MAHVNLDAMIKREDFAREIKDEPTPDTIRELNLSMLLPDAPIRRLLRKPDFQRETNHWTPDQVLYFIRSFLDGAVIPGVILWRSTNFVFVIDGAHRLSALCAWISDDYGDRSVSKSFYNDEISKEQNRVANRVRTLIDKTVGSFKSLEGLVGKAASDIAGRRAGSMFTRPIFLQTVVGDAKVAEESFFAINSQGTPLDDTETYLIKNRNKPVAIGARAIVRAGSGHAYWSAFSQKNQATVVSIATELFKLLFVPEATVPLKTLDLPLGGSSSPIDALAVLLDYLIVANTKSGDAKELTVEDILDSTPLFQVDDSGEATIKALQEALKITKRITGNTGESLGLHPAVYFTNDKGKHSRFLFLGVAAAVADRIRNNDDGWFKKFTLGRHAIETFLIDHKSVIGIVLQNLSKTQRIPKMKALIDYLVSEASHERALNPEAAFKHIGIGGKIYDLSVTKLGVAFSAETKSQIFYRQAIQHALKCPICSGLLDPSKSASYDHIKPVREKGLGSAENGQMVHPYCNTGIKN
ncbi:DUF262 domain-containing protein [Ferrovibrio sp.]|uniref:HNH endonuclease family protein n=1 Tax=Ferrovibrio sp. TaxID=1917215 RepID=UPI000CB3FBAF|nr:DUF262 domain-containing protein [Ferrovibrio sp.]PJI41822.1 MAG: hypothetical protein CTR53_05000 [Ferrovibrio sp.]